MVRRPAKQAARVPGFSEPAGRDRRPEARLIAQLEAAQEEIAVINGVLRTIVSGATLSEILKVFASNLKTLVPFDRCSISIYDPERRVFHVPYMVMGGRVVETQELPRPFASSPLGRVVETGRPLIRNRIRSDRRHYEMDRAFLRKGFASEMLLPLVVGRLVFGTFNMGSWTADLYTEDVLRRVQEIVPAVAVAVWHHVKERGVVPSAP